MKINKLSKQQIKAFSESDARINVLEGSVRSGKSFIALMRFVEELRSGPDGLYCIAGRSEITIIRNVIAMLNDYLGGMVNYNKGQSSFELFGKRVYCVGANDERAELKIRGATFAGALVDEITAIPESFFKMLLSRLSVDNSKLIGTTNPDSPYHWLKKDFIDRQDKLNMKIFKFTLDDNPALSEEYKDNLKAEYSGVWYQRFILGEWCLAEGLIYDMFDRDRHTFDTPHTFAEFYLAGVDVGAQNPTAVTLIGYNSKTRPHLWVEKEFYYKPSADRHQKTHSELVRDIQKTFEGYPIRMYYADPSALAFITEMKRQGMPVTQADNSVIDGIAFVANLFSQGDLHISKSCKHLIEELYSYSWDSKGVKDGNERPVKQSDHCCDSLRYILFSRFGKLKELKMKSDAERKLEREQRLWNQNPMSYPGLSPSTNNLGWQAIHP